MDYLKNHFTKEGERVLRTKTLNIDGVNYFVKLIVIKKKRGYLGLFFVDGEINPSLICNFNSSDTFCSAFQKILPELFSLKKSQYLF